MRKSDTIIATSGDTSGSKCEYRALGTCSGQWEVAMLLLQSVTNDMKIPLDGKKWDGSPPTSLSSSRVIFSDVPVQAVTLTLSVQKVASFLALPLCPSRQQMATAFLTSNRRKRRTAPLRTPSMPAICVRATCRGWGVRGLPELASSLNSFCTSQNIKVRGHSSRIRSCKAADWDSASPQTFRLALWMVIHSYCNVPLHLLHYIMLCYIIS